MRRIVALSFVLLPFAAFADVLPPTPEEFQQFLAALFGMLGGGAGVSALGVVALIVQGLMLWTRSSFGAMAGKYRLLLMSGLSVVGGVIAQMVLGQPFLAALFSASVLPLLQLFAHQLYKQFFERSA